MIELIPVFAHGTPGLFTLGLYIWIGASLFMGTITAAVITKIHISKMLDMRRSYVFKA